MADIIDIHHITDVAPVSKLFHDILAQERAIQVELENRIRNRKDMEAELLSLTASMTDVLHLGHAEAHDLTNTVKSTASEALQVSQRVRRLDTAQANLITTIDHIHRALDSGTCLTAVQNALESQDYETAAINISKYQQLQNECPGGAKTSGGLPRAAYANKIVSEAHEKLLSVARERIAVACAEKDTESMLRFLQLYKPLNVPREGMAAALAFVRSSTQQDADGIFSALERQLDSDPTTTSFVECMAKTLKSVHSSIKANCPVISEAFGSTYVVDLIKDVTLALDEKIPRIVQAFMNTRGISVLLKGIKASPVSPSFDTVKADALLIELRGLMACIQEFLSFLTSTAAKAIHPKPVPRDLQDVISDGEHHAVLMDLQGAYSLLESTYMQRSVAKAIEWDSILPGAMMSSMLDDTLFILRQSTKRAFSTSNLQCFTTTVACAAALLRGPFKTALTNKLSGTAAAITGCFKDDQVPGPTDVELAAAPLNNVVQSTAFTAKLHETLESTALHKFTVASEADAVRVSLEELQQAGAELQQLSLHYCESISDTLVHQLLREPVALLQSTDYEISDSQYSSREMEPGWAPPLCASLQHYWDCIVSGLGMEVQQEVSRTLIARLLFWVESILAGKAFSALGGLLLDRDIRALSNGLAEVTEQPVRERFVRLNQIVELLTLEQIGDVDSVWNDDSITWRLTPAEVRKVLLWRIDFDRSDIAALRL